MPSHRLSCGSSAPYRGNALAFGQQLRESGLIASTGTVGDCFDNAVAESLFTSLKVELLYHQGLTEWPTRAAARSAIFYYIEA